MKLKLLYISIIFNFLTIQAQEKILVFVSHENTYYSEYIVLKRGLEAAGYQVDVRNASGMETSTYMIPSGTTIEETANTLSGSNYNQFVTQFLNSFGGSWNATDNPTPNYIPVNGRIQDIESMNTYKALIVVGGTGAIDYRVDGNYLAQGNGLRQINAQNVQSAAEKLNSLAIEALSNGKPLMAQCHGASLAAFWRISGSGLSESILRGQYATGFPESSTPEYLSELGINFRANDRVTISSSNTNFSASNSSQSKIITTRDWYPQTVVHATRSILNIIETYPQPELIKNNSKILIIHGGAIDVNNCSASNRNNDVPCNYGTGDNLPADYTHLLSLLQADSNQDEFSFTVENVNLTGNSLPFNPNNQAAIEAYLKMFDGIVFFKHWNTGITSALQNAIVNYADQGGGVIALHHGLYNDSQNGLNKNILIQQLFGAESSQNGWSANRTSYDVFNSNFGHFITTYGVSYSLDSVLSPNVWSSNPLPISSNASHSYYNRFNVFDEIYNNMTYLSGQNFGRGVNAINVLLSNNQSPASQAHTTGFVKLFNNSNDNSIGRVAFFEIGENRLNFNISHPYGQIVRNAITWISQNKISTDQTLNIVSHLQNDSNSFSFWPNPVSDILTVSNINKSEIKIYSTLGNEVPVTILNGNSIDVSFLTQGVYILKINSESKLFVKE